MKLKIKKLHPDAVVPQYQTAGAACFDLHALDPVKLPLMIGGNGSKAATFGTGLEIEVPKDHVMLIFSRSGHAFAHDVRLANCVGVIDSDYRGEIKVRLAGDTKNQIVFRSGDRIAQAMIVPIPRVEFEVVEELTATERGTGGFGSTGA